MCSTRSARITQTSRLAFRLTFRLASRCFLRPSTPFLLTSVLPFLSFSFLLSTSAQNLPTASGEHDVLVRIGRRNDQPIAFSATVLSHNVSRNQRHRWKISRNAENPAVSRGEIYSVPPKRDSSRPAERREKPTKTLKHSKNIEKNIQKKICVTKAF